MKTICTDCKHQASCGHAEVEACGGFAELHWSDVMPTIERTEDADGTAVYRSDTVELPSTPGCSCDGLRQALSDAAAKGREIARLDAVVEERQARKRTCTMTKNDINWPVEGEYTWECSACNESTALLACVNENGDTDYIKPKFCASCGAKVV